jgi:uncharacterized membrane protein (DUF485 family)
MQLNMTLLETAGYIPQGISYEQLIMDYCHEYSVYNGYALLVFSAAVFIYCILLLFKKDNQFLSMLKYILSFIMFFGSIMAVYFYSISVSSESIMRALSFGLKTIIISAIVYIIYAWIAIPENRLKITRIFKSIDEETHPESDDPKTDKSHGEHEHGKRRKAS